MFVLRTFLVCITFLLPSVAVAQHHTPKYPTKSDTFLKPPILVAYADTSLRPQKVLGSVGAPKMTRPSSVHRFPWGQCTYYVASRRPISFRGHAKSWITNARRAGYTIGTEPMAGAVVQLKEGPYGHVAYVESVSEDGKTFSISEWNYIGLGKLSKRTLSTESRSIAGFIY